MKLAEALAVRSDKQKRLAAVEKRATAIALLQEGDEPVESPTALLEEYAQLQADLLALVRRINATNMANTIDSGQTMAEAVGQRERQARMAKFYRLLAEKANPAMGHDKWRYGRAEIKQVPGYDVGVLNRLADEAAERASSLDIAIQKKNWEVDLLD